MRCLLELDSKVAWRAASEAQEGNNHAKCAQGAKGQFGSEKQGDFDARASLQRGFLRAAATASNSARASV